MARRKSLLLRERNGEPQASFLRRFDDEHAPRSKTKATGTQRNRKTARNDLAGLEKTLARVGPQITVESRSFDFGAPIELRYRRELFVPGSLSLSASWDHHASSMLAESEPFSVEAFGGPGISEPAGAIPPPARPTFYGARPASEPATTAPSPAAAPSPAVAPPTAGAAQPPVPSTPQTPVDAPAADVKAARSLSDDDFSADLAKILSDAQALGQADSRPVEPPPTQLAPGDQGQDQDAPDAPTGPPPEHGHSVFDRMASAMRYANTFDLGAVEMSRRLEQFERDLDREEATAEAMRLSRTLRSSPDLDDLDVAADLAQIAADVKKRKDNDKHLPPQPPGDEKPVPLPLEPPPPAPRPDPRHGQPLPLRPSKPEPKKEQQSPAETDTGDPAATLPAGQLPVAPAGSPAPGQSQEEVPPSDIQQDGTPQQPAQPTGE